MATSKLNPEQFVKMVNCAKGVYLVYPGKDNLATAQYFFDEGYVPANKSQDEIFKVWRNVVDTFWRVKQAEAKLRADNDGIRSKLRASTPMEVIFRCDDGRVAHFPLEHSVWSKIGLIPTKKDIERLSKERDFKASIHRAAKASFDALGFRVALPKEENGEMN